MCESHSIDRLDGSIRPYLHEGGERRTMSRRDVLRAGAGTALAGATLSSLTGPAAMAAGAGPVGPRAEAGGAVPGTGPVTLAMHVHASFSEFTGSMECQLNEAQSNGVDVLWWTEHDWRMAGACYRTQFSFDSLRDDTQFGLPWILRPSASGCRKATTIGGIVSTPVSQRDPSPLGALEVGLAQAVPDDVAAYGFFVDTSASNYNHRTGIDGLSVSVDVYPQSISGNGFLEVLLVLSNHLARGDRPNGIYTLSYRFGIDGSTLVGGNPSGSRVQEGLLGIVTATLAPGRYTTVTLDPLADASVIWPDIDARDNGFQDLYFRACSSGAGSALGYFDNMTTSYAAPSAAVATQAALMSAYAPVFPSVQQRASFEFSFWEQQHLNVFGGDVPLTDFSGQTELDPPPLPDAAYWRRCANNRARGALTSLNHVFGVHDKPVADPGLREALVIAQVLGNQACGADILEVGYAERGGMGLSSHQAVWDACSRNGIVVTANGVNDDHFGILGSWATQPNHYLTIAWSASTGDTDLLLALATGRVFVAEQDLFPGTLDLQLDDGTVMGGVTARGALPVRQLQILASGLPAGSIVEVVQGPIDFAGPSMPAPGTTVVRALPQSAFAQTGSAVVDVTTTADTFVRVNVTVTTGTGVECAAFSNPIYVVDAALARCDPRRR